MIKIEIADASLRESEQIYEARLSFKEKLETAKLLDKLQVDVIETGPVGEAPADAVLIRTLSTTLAYSAICVPVPLNKSSIDRTWDALSKAQKPRLNLIVPTSTVQMEYRHGMRAAAMLPLAIEILEYCVSLCPETEFTAEDSTRSDLGFLSEMLRGAIAAGVKYITLCDSAGELLPEEIGKFIQSVYASVPELENVVLCVHLMDNLGLASAAALSAIGSGARQIKVSSSGKSGTLSLEQFLNVIKVRGETLGIAYNINDTTLQRTSAQLAALAGAGGMARALDEDSGKHGDGEALPEDASMEDLGGYIASMGYDVTEDDLERIFVQFQEIAKNKKVVSRDIDALVAETAGQAVPTYQLRSYVINSGNAITATAFIELVKDGTAKDAISAGDGPLDAAIKAA